MLYLYNGVCVLPPFLSERFDLFNVNYLKGIIYQMVHRVSFPAQDPLQHQNVSVLNFNLPFILVVMLIRIKNL